MDLGSTQPLTEMSTRSISWGLRRPVRKADNLTTILCHCHLNFLEPSGPLQVCNGTDLPFHRATTHLQLNIIIIIIIIIIEFLTSQLWLGNIHLSWDVVINRIRLGGLICRLNSFLQLNMCQEHVQLYYYYYYHHHHLLYAGYLHSYS